MNETAKQAFLDAIESENREAKKTRELLTREQRMAAKAKRINEIIRRRFK